MSAQSEPAHLPEPGPTYPSSSYPVHYSVEQPSQFTRLQLAIRVAAFLALGILGVSFGTVIMFAYLALPVFSASRMAAGVEPRAYIEQDGPRILGVLHWFAAISAWAGLVSERLPRHSPAEIVDVAIESDEARPGIGSALLRIFTGLPSAIVLGVLCWLGMFVWLWAALNILFTQRVGPHAFQYLLGLQRWSFRLLAYQASLVDEYPPFSFADVPPEALPRARVQM